MNSEAAPISKWFILTGLKGNPSFAPFMWPPFNLLLVGIIPTIILLVLSAINIVPFQAVEYVALICVIIIILSIPQMIANNIFGRVFRFSLNDEGVIVNLTLENIQNAIYRKGTEPEAKKFPWSELQSVQMKQSFSEKSCNIASVIVMRKNPPGTNPHWLAFIARPYIGAQEDRIILPALQKENAEEIRNYIQQKISA
jgi:hypothetical protein